MIVSVFEIYPWLIDIFVVIFGLILGSFATALAHRIPRQRQWILDEIGEQRKEYNKNFLTGLMTRSRCPSCEHVLGAKDLFPVVSYAINSGKCNYCKAGIGIRYPLAEAFTALLLWLIYTQFGFSFTGFLLAFSLPFMMASSLVDFEFLILPDELTVLMAILGLIYQIYLNFFTGFAIDPATSFVMTLLCALFYGFIGWAMRFVFFKLAGKEGLGWGDIKLFALGGLWLGWGLMPAYLLLSSVIGLVIGGGWKMYKGEALFPYGPALILSLYIVVIYRNFFEGLF